MKTGTILLLGAAAFVVYSALQLGTAANTVQLMFSGVQVKGPLNFVLQFVVQNVSNATINFRALTGTVTVNGTNLGNISTFDQVIIQPTSQQNLNVTFQPSILGLAAEVMNSLSQPGQTLEFSFDGNMNVDTFVLPVSVQTSITL